MMGNILQEEGMQEVHTFWEVDSMVVVDTL